VQSQVYLSFAKSSKNHGSIFLNKWHLPDESSDIYLIGLVLFFILTASFPNNYCGFQLPFKNEFDPFPKCQIINSEKELIRIIEKACCFKKEDRYQNISQFENDISKMFKAHH
jgi:serine/threonine protein kinase